MGITGALVNELGSLHDADSDHAASTTDTHTTPRHVLSDHGMPSEAHENRLAVLSLLEARLQHDSGNNVAVSDNEHLNSEPDADSDADAEDNRSPGSADTNQTNTAQHGVVTDSPRRVKRQAMTVAECYCYLLHVSSRDSVDGVLFRSGKLFRQFILDAYIKIEEQRLNFIKFNQSTLRAESYDKIKKFVAQMNDATNHLAATGQHTVWHSNYSTGFVYEFAAMLFEIVQK